MSEDQVLFKEKQYLGRNLHMLVVRLILATFCFAAYYWSQNKEMSGELFLIVGLGILLLSIFLTFIGHFNTRVMGKAIELDSLRSIRKVKIPLKNIKNVEVVPYDRFYINNPVFNLHVKGRIHFYSTGEKAVQIEDKDELIYLIGSQQPYKLKEVIEQQVKTLRS